MSVAVSCSECGTRLRPTDQFCPSCGHTLGATGTRAKSLGEFHPANGPLSRIGDFALRHVRGLLILAVIAGLAGVAQLYEEESVRERRSSPGYGIAEAVVFRSN